MRFLLGVFLVCSLLSLSSCVEPVVHRYPYVEGQVKKVITPVTVPSYNILYTVILFSDGRGYIFLGQCPVEVEEGKIVKIFYDSEYCSGNRQELAASVIKGVIRVSSEPVPPVEPKPDEGK